MKLHQNNFISLAIIGSLFALSYMYSGKVQADIRKKKQNSGVRLQPAMQRKNAPQDVKSMTEFDSILSQGKPAILMIHASWCGACHVSEKPFADAAEDNLGINFIKAEGSKDVPGITKRFAINGYPTFVIFDAQGKEVHKFSGGGWPKSFLNQKIDRKSVV